MSWSSLMDVSLSGSAGELGVLLDGQVERPRRCCEWGLARHRDGEAERVAGAVVLGGAVGAYEQPDGAAEQVAGDVVEREFLTLVAWIGHRSADLLERSVLDELRPAHPFDGA